MMSKPTLGIKLLAYLGVPLITIIFLLVLNPIVGTWWIMLIWSIVIYIVSFIVSGLLVRGDGKPFFRTSKDFARKMLWILVKSFLFSIGLVSLTFAFVTDNAPMCTFEYPLLAFDTRYFVIMVILSLMAFLMVKISIGGE